MNFFLFISREQDKSKAQIGKMGMQNPCIFFSFPSVVCNVLEGQSHVARKSGMIHCCFLLPWSPLSQFQLPPDLSLAPQRQVFSSQLWCQEVGNGRARGLQVPEKLQLPPASFCALGQCFRGHQICGSYKGKGEVIGLYHITRKDWVPEKGKPGNPKLM